jgi:hypothetical protein
MTGSADMVERVARAIHPEAFEEDGPFSGTLPVALQRAAFALEASHYTELTWALVQAVAKLNTLGITLPRAEAVLAKIGGDQ